MKKRVTIFTTAILCVISFVIGAIAAYGVFEVASEFRPYANARLGGNSNTNNSGDNNDNLAVNNQDTANFIGVESAKDLALNKAGFSRDAVRFDRTELDRDMGVWRYEIEFYANGTEYSVDVGATDGAILKFETEIFD